MEIQFIVHLILTITGLTILTIGNIGKKYFAQFVSIRTFNNQSEFPFGRSRLTIEKSEFSLEIL